MAFAFCVHSYRSHGIEHSILSLVPEDTAEKHVDETNRQFLASLERSLFFAVSEKSAAQQLAVRLEESGACRSVFGRIQPEKQHAVYTFLNTHRLAFVDSQTQALLADEKSYSSWVLAQVFNPFAGVGIDELSADPLLLVRRARTNLTPSTSTRIEDGWIVAQRENESPFYLVQASLKETISLSKGALSVSSARNSLLHGSRTKKRQKRCFRTRSAVSCRPPRNLLARLSEHSSVFTVLRFPFYRACFCNGSHVSCLRQRPCGSPCDVYKSDRYQR